jgi:exoribonuclease-2
MQNNYSPIDLTQLAKRSMIERHLLPDFPPAVLREINQLTSAAKPNSPLIKDLRHYLWFSLDIEFLIIPTKN